VRMKIGYLTISVLLALVVAACSGSAGELERPMPLTPTQAAGGLAPASELQSNCLKWPEQEISRTNHAYLVTSLAEGEPAVDFSLQDVDGATHTLSGLLQTKPVLLVLGGFT